MPELVDTFEVDDDAIGVVPFDSVIVPVVPDEYEPLLVLALVLSAFGTLDVAELVGSVVRCSTAPVELSFTAVLLLLSAVSAAALPLLMLLLVPGVVVVVLVDELDRQPNSASGKTRTMNMVRIVARCSDFILFSLRFV